VSYVQSGLYPVRLTLVTENSTGMTTYNTSVEQTVAVESTSQPYALFLYSGVVPNPAVINVAESAAWPPTSLDPNLDYEAQGAEICANIFSTLLAYNGSSTTNFIPMAASEVPSVSNGGISPSYTSYTFHIRPGLEFSNGDPLTAYDVYYSIVRSLLFRGSTGVDQSGVADWIVAQYLVARWPGYFGSDLSLVRNVTDTAGYNSIVNSMDYSNASNTITFKLIKPFASQLFFTALADVQAAAILDSRWLEHIGAGITFTPAGFYAYQNEGNQGNFSLRVMNDPVGSGPYMIQSYAPGQSISLVPNPGFPGIPGNPGIPKANDTVVIQWVKNPQTAYDLFRSGQADIVTGLSPEYFPQINQQVASGEAKIYQAPTLVESALGFSEWEGSDTYNQTVETVMNSYLGTTQYHMPSDYFENLDVRKAWVYAFNYAYFVNEVLGNKRYGVDVGSTYAGAIIQGYPDYVPANLLQNVPCYNLTYAKQLLKESGQYDTSINIPFPIYPYTLAGMDNQTQFAMVQMYAAALHSIDPNIIMTPIFIANPNTTPAVIWWPISIWYWGADYPHPSDVVDMWYQAPFAPAWLNSTGHPDQAATFAQMNSLISEADSTTNATLAAEDYKQIEQIAINLYLMVYLTQPNSFYVVKPYMNGYEGQVSYLLNPMAPFVPDYVWWVKTCGSTEACSGRGIGP